MGGMPNRIPASPAPWDTAPLMIPVHDWAPVASAALAAVAASASWSSVWQNRRERIAAERPDLHLEVQQSMDTGSIKLNITNNGGPAKYVRFLVVEGNQMVYGHPQPTAMFRAGESRHIDTPMFGGMEKKPKGFIGAYDMSGSRYYLWPFQGKDKVYRMKGWRRTRKSFSDESLMTRLHPGFNFDAMEVMRYETVDRSF
jgi:hypothetical protein